MNQLLFQMFGIEEDLVYQHESQILDKTNEAVKRNEDDRFPILNVLS